MSGVVVGVLNGSMFGTPNEPGEHVDWNRPDVLTLDHAADLFGTSVEEYAEANPHMILFEVDVTDAFLDDLDVPGLVRYVETVDTVDDVPGWIICRVRPIEAIRVDGRTEYVMADRLEWWAYAPPAVAAEIGLLAQQVER